MKESQIVPGLLWFLAVMSSSPVCCLGEESDASWLFALYFQLIYYKSDKESILLLMFSCLS